KCIPGAAQHAVVRCRPGIVAHSELAGIQGFLVRPGTVDHFLERDVFVALGVAADRVHLFQVVVGLQQVALFGLPHAVIGPGQGVVRIGGQRLLVPVFGVVVAAELAAGVADEGGDIDIVVIAHGAQRRDAAFVVALVVDQRIGLVPAVEELFGRAVLFLLCLLLGIGAAGRRRAFRRGPAVGFARRGQ